MTRVIGHGRYAGEVYPSGAGGGGGAGAASVPLSRQRFIDGDTAQTGLNGSATEPFKTIVQFTTARSNAVSGADSDANFVGWLMPSIAGYVEATVAFPGRCSTELRADSVSIPGTGGVQIAGNATWDNTTGTAASNAANLSLHNIQVTGSLTITDNGGAPVSLVCISGDEEPFGAGAGIGSISAGTTTRLSSISLNNALCDGDLLAGADSASRAGVILGGGSIVVGNITAQSLICSGSIIGNDVTVFTGGSAVFQNTTFSGVTNLTAAVSNFDGPSWLSFREKGGTRAVGTTVLVAGGYSGGAVEGAPLSTGSVAAVTVSLNGGGAVTAGFTGEHSGNHYSTASVTQTSVTVLADGAAPGDTILITRTLSPASALAVVDGPSGLTRATIPTSTRGFVLMQFDGTNWTLAEGGSLAA